jgi:hypothetical protein
LQVNYLNISAFVQRDLHLHAVFNQIVSTQKHLLCLHKAKPNFPYMFWSYSLKLTNFVCSAIILICKNHAVWTLIWGHILEWQYKRIIQKYKVLFQHLDPWNICENSVDVIFNTELRLEDDLWFFLSLIFVKYWFVKDYEPNYHQFWNMIRKNFNH